MIQTQTRILSENEMHTIFWDFDIKTDYQMIAWRPYLVLLIIVISALGTVPEGFEKSLDQLEMRGSIQTVQTTELLRSARIL